MVRRRDRIIKDDASADLVARKPRTAKELVVSLRKSGLVGMWKDRADLVDSAESARKLRERLSERSTPRRRLNPND